MYEPPQLRGTAPPMSRPITPMSAPITPTYLPPPPAYYPSIAPQRQQQRQQQQQPARRQIAFLRRLSFSSSSNSYCECVRPACCHCVLQALLCFTLAGVLYWSYALQYVSVFDVLLLVVLSLTFVLIAIKGADTQDVALLEVALAYETAVFWLLTGESRV